MILVIAEKPSLGRDIADALPGQVTERNNRFIRKGDYAVTWVFGHMLSLKEPEDYDMKYKKKCEIPFLRFHISHYFSTRIRVANIVFSF